MKRQKTIRIAWAVVSVMAASAVPGQWLGALEIPQVKPAQHRQKPVKPKPLSELHHAAPAIPKEEPNVAPAASAGYTTNSPFAALANSSPNATTLSPPASLTYSGSSNALTITDSGTGRGISATVTNTGSGSSALYGSTVGSGAGLTGYNGGTGGPGGKFEVTNANSAQAGAFATTNGTGSAVLATITNTSNESAAILGQSMASASITTIGVEGDGYTYGVHGYVAATANDGGAGVYGENDNTSTTGNYGVYGYSASGIGLGAFSSSNYAVSAISGSNDAIYASTSSYGQTIYAENDTTSAEAYTVYATISAGNAVEGVATAEYGRGVDGESVDGIGVAGSDTGQSGNGIGVYGYSATGNAGDFEGNVRVAGVLTVGNTVYQSDKNLKTDFLPVDGKDLLDRVGHMDISSWYYKSDLQKRHVGPMAQDFHAAFGLNGEDEKHISEVDIAGVSLAAIKELHAEMQQKDTQIAELKAQLAAQTAATAAQALATAAQAAQVSQIEQQFTEMRSALSELQASDSRVAKR